MRPDFEAGVGVLPVVVQDARSLRIIMIGCMREKDFDFTLGSGLLTLGFPEKKYSGILLVGDRFLRIWGMWVSKDRKSIVVQVKFSSVSQRRKARRELTGFAPIRRNGGNYERGTY